MIRRCLALLVLLLPLGGCAYIASVSGDLDQRLDTWVRQQEYGTALQAISYVKPERPDYRRLRERYAVIERQAHQFEQKTISQADEHLRDGRWAEAVELYTAALDKYPQGKALQSGYEQLQQLQEQHLADLDDELLLARASSLLELLPLYSRRAEVNPDDGRLQQQLGKARDEAGSVAEELTRRGNAALAQGNLQTAQRMLPLALRLAPTAATKRANQMLLQHQGTQRAALGRAATTPASAPDNGAALLQQYRQAMKANDLHEAQRIVALLQLQPKPPAEIERLRKELERAIAASVRQHLDRGMMLYSHGEYEKALASWHEAKVLDPDNERVNAHIARAERVLSKLNTLQQKQSSN